MKLPEDHIVDVAPGERFSPSARSLSGYAFVKGSQIKPGVRAVPTSDRLSSFNNPDSWNEAGRERFKSRKVDAVNRAVLTAVLNVVPNEEGELERVSLEQIDHFVALARSNDITEFTKLDVPDGISDLHAQLYDATLKVLGARLLQPVTSTSGVMRIS